MIITKQQSIDMFNLVELQIGVIIVHIIINNPIYIIISPGDIAIAI